MANTKKLFKDLYKDFYGKTLILQTTAGVLYVWKQGECKCYNYNKEKNLPDTIQSFDDYKKIIVEKGITNPLYIKPSSGYWSVPAFVMEDFGDYLGIITPYVRGARVSDFKESVRTMSEATSHYWGDRSGYHTTEIRIYKDRKTLRVSYWIFNDGTYLSYIDNPDYQEGRRSYYYGRNFGASLTDPKTVEALQAKDENGNLAILHLCDEEYKTYAKKPTAHGTNDFCNSTFWESDYRKGWIEPVHVDDRCHCETLKLSEDTQQIISNFFKDQDKGFTSYLKSYYKISKIQYIDELTTMLKAADAEQGAKLLGRKKAKEAVAKEYLGSVEFGNANASVGFERRGDEILAYIRRNSRGYWGNTGKAMVVYNVKTRTKRLFLEDRGKIVIPIPSWSCIDGWFNIYTYGWREDVNNMVKPTYSFKPSYEEVIKGTNLELLLKYKPSINKLYYGLISKLPAREILNHFNIKTFWEAMDENFFTMLGLYVLIGEKTPICQQLLQNNLPYLFLSFLHRADRDSYTDLDNPGRGYYSCNKRIGYHGKATNLKKCFDLSKKQLEIVNDYIHEKMDIAERELDNSSYRYYNSTPTDPAIYKMGDVLHTEVKCLDAETFKSLIYGVSNQKINDWNWFSWGRMDEYSEVCKLFENSQPSVFMDWLKKGYSLETYNDYLKMRIKLKRISEEMHQPEIYNEDGFPIVVEDKAELQRLHDLASKLTMEYQNVAKTKMFNSALTLARSYEWKDKDDQVNGLQIVAPNSMSDLVKEGTCLHHCLKSSMWVDAVADRKSVILFVRRKTDVQTPYFSIEMDPRGSIRQCHGMSNCNPTKEVIEFLHRWASANKNVNKQSIVASYGAMCAPQ